MHIFDDEVIYTFMYFFSNLRDSAIFLTASTYEINYGRKTKALKLALVFLLLLCEHGFYTTVEFSSLLAQILLFTKFNCQ